ncbi:hypothetical protein WBJ53_14100 [Spirosoma sp. SC4-14]|uniref:hypothetical protein n=1 Tax=Spirosoma sp. SC4-14 TaxID=3128900 RepID=UPI0030D12C2E
MKRFFHKLHILPAFGILLLFFLTSCEQQVYEPNLNVAPGGGTISTYTAYTLASSDGTNVYGRVVFYKYSSSVTLVQIGLYNTDSGMAYSSSIYQGKLTESLSTVLKPLDAISGATGEFSSNKYYVINEAGFYDNLSSYNANVKIMAGTTLVASGNIGINATPVAHS